MTMWDNDKDVNGDNLEEDHEYRCVFLVFALPDLW